MKNIVLDTNILVSALWNKQGNPSVIVRQVLEGGLSVCYDSRIIAEYTDVLNRPEFPFASEDINELLDFIKEKGISVVPPEADISFADDDDRMFYEVAVFCNAALITGNTRHYPKESLVMTVVEYLDVLEDAFRLNSKANK